MDLDLDLDSDMDMDTEIDKDISSKRERFCLGCHIPSFQIISQRQCLEKNVQPASAILCNQRELSRSFFLCIGPMGRATTISLPAISVRGGHILAHRRAHSFAKRNRLPVDDTFGRDVG